jgi:hypothetical protein
MLCSEQTLDLQFDFFTALQATLPRQKGEFQEQVLLQLAFETRLQRVLTLMPSPGLSRHAVPRLFHSQTCAGVHCEAERRLQAALP